MAVGAPPPQFTPYKGSDSAGRVSFTLATFSEPTTRGIDRFHFANRCSAAGTTVNVEIKVGRRHRFSYRKHGITVKGVLRGNKLRRASGTARIHTKDCDSGVLKFTAHAS
jgi:hypothetical protein